MAYDYCAACQAEYKTMDDCYNQVIEQLTARGRIKEVSSRLMSLTTNHERVSYLYSILKGLNMFPLLKLNTKDGLVAEYYRCQGNNYFKQKQYYEAWQCYNLSLLYGLPTQEHFILAMSNRSAVFFALEKYEECLEDIKFVCSNPFPKKLETKLEERKRKCLSKVSVAEAVQRKDLSEESNIAEILRLKGPRDEKYVSSSTKLKVVYTEEMGRHVIANEDIKVGDVLVQEDPYMTVLLKSQFLFCCGFCLSRKMNLYPCPSCTYTMYCSVDCREMAYKQYHKLECRILPSLVSLEYTKMDWLALRALLKSRTDHVKWADMLQTAEDAESRSHTDLWGCVEVNNKWVYDSKYYTAIHTLASNIEKRNVSDIFRKSLTAATLLRFLSLLHFLRKDNPEMAELSRRYVGGTLLLHIMTSPTNMHGISTNIEDSEGHFVEEHNIASGAYAFLSLLNHSCAPNVVRYSKLGSSQMSLIAIRPIKKGMQIFDNYGYHHALQERESRQSNLKYQYKFTCTCEACLNDWPMHAKLKEAVGLPEGLLYRKLEILSADVIDKLMKADKATALKTYKPLCELVEVLDSFAPCKELAECQEALKQCLVIFHGVVPFGYGKEIPWKAYPPCAVFAGKDVCRRRSFRKDDEEDECESS